MVTSQRRRVNAIIVTKPEHYINECQKRLAKEKKKELGLAISTSSNSFAINKEDESRNIVHDSYSSFSVDET